MSVLADLQSAFAPGRVIAPEHIPVGHRSDWGVALASDEQPAALVYAHDADDVSRALEICTHHACPVVTQGGLIGKVAKVKEDNEIEVEVADGVKVRVVKSTIAQVLTKTEPAK